MNTVIRHARIIDPANQRDERADFWIVDGTIGPACEQADEEIDGNGLWLLPGGVDLCARIGAPGLPGQGISMSEIAAAAAGGFTHVLCPPEPQMPLDTPAAVRHLQTSPDANSVCRVHTLGALTQELAGVCLADMATLRAAGCSGLSNGRSPIADTRVLRCALQYAASLDMTVFLCPEDPWLAGAGCAHDGRVATRLGLEGIPTTAEVAAMARDLALIADTGVRAHFERLSTAGAVELLDTAKQRGLPVTADVAIHQLFLTDLDISEFDARCHTRPPLRDQNDRSALIEGVRSGVIDAIVSDHTPLEPDAKLAPFPNTEPGISGLETALALGLRLIEDRQLTATEWVAATSTRPGKILGHGGDLGLGRPADLCLVDPNAVWRLDPAAMLSHGRNTPFSGWEFRGRTVRTLLAGRASYIV